ncbi:uncharacterized protein LOC127381159 [Apus apus]|uniref:uncharacterized protein LOC127381159 n=1 Tax=Apus apus TaxID=8895 RepID=UPI0021F857E5|nr:uncharacterized protein LOC127381159 [Apus apus]
MRLLAGKGGATRNGLLGEHIFQAKAVTHLVTLSGDKDCGKLRTPQASPRLRFLIQELLVPELEQFLKEDKETRQDTLGADVLGHTMVSPHWWGGHHTVTFGHQSMSGADPAPFYKGVVSTKRNQEVTQLVGMVRGMVRENRDKWDGRGGCQEPCLMGRKHHVDGSEAEGERSRESIPESREYGGWQEPLEMAQATLSHVGSPIEEGTQDISSWIWDISRDGDTSLSLELS